METMITTSTRVKRMTRLKSFVLPAVMACTLSMPAFAQSVDQTSPQPQDPGKRTFGGFHGRHGREEAMFGNG